MEDFKDFELGIPRQWTPNEELIKVIGVGGGGCNAVTYMYNQNVEGCSFVVCNTDSQALQKSNVPVKIQMGSGLGAGTDPTAGRNAALEVQDKIKEIVLTQHTKMLFITAGMGGGTGTGAAPVIAKMAKDAGILTVGVVTLPFESEGNGALTKAWNGVIEMEKNVDSLVVINNEKLYDQYSDQLIHDAFPKADEVLTTAVRGIVEIIQKPGFVNVDFKDVSNMMRNSGLALMGCGTGKGEQRIDQAVQEALESPLLNNYNLRQAKNVLINITTAKNDNGLTMNDLKVIGEKIKEYTGGANSFKRGLIYDESEGADDTIHITAIVTGLKLTDVGKGVKTGDIIMIDKNYVYNSGTVSGDEGIYLESVDDTYCEDITYNMGQLHNNFRFDRKPVLLVGSDTNISELENTTAIKRINKKIEN